MRRFPYLTLLVAALLLLAVVVGGCGNSGDTTTSVAVGGGATTTAAQASVPFKFGLAAPFTGQYAEYGRSHKAGADIAVEQLNAAGGVNGGQASYVTGDDLGDPKEAVLVAQKFIDDKSVLFIDGHMFSGATLAAGEKYQQAKLPMITGSATNPDITDIGKYIWRIVMTDAAQGKGLADYAVKDLGKKKIAIIHDDNDYGKGLADAFEQAVPAAGGEVVAREQYTSGDAEFKSQLTKIKQGNPDLLFFAGYHPEGSKIAQQARDLGITAQFLGSDGFASDQLIKVGGAAVDGMLVSTFFDYTKTDPAVQAFVTAYKAKNNNQNPDYFAATSYDLIMMAAEAAKKSGSNSREAIQTGLTNIGTYTGITGPITFDAKHDVKKPLNIIVVKNGAFATADKQPSATD